MSSDIPVWGVVACVIALLSMFMMRRKRAQHIWETTPGGPYTVTVTDNGIICEHPKRPKESIRWDDVIEIRLLTTSEGPHQPDMWFLFLGAEVGCSVPSETKGFEQVWEVFKQRFPGVDYGAILDAKTSDNQKTLWKKESNQASEVKARKFAEPQG
jgi:hypothetical protein